MLVKVEREEIHGGMGLLHVDDKVDLVAGDRLAWCDGGGSRSTGIESGPTQDGAVSFVGLLVAEPLKMDLFLGVVENNPRVKNGSCFCLVCIDRGL